MSHLMDLLEDELCELAVEARKVEDPWKRRVCLHQVKQLRLMLQSPGGDSVPSIHVEGDGRWEKLEGRVSGLLALMRNLAQAVHEQNRELKDLNDFVNALGEFVALYVQTEAQPCPQKQTTPSTQSTQSAQ